ncbi:MAG TPA: type II toxin-antitoxin system Phd/YefM family antitoxin [Ignavibacteria bacterium]|nr:type II toxin-antitoxin system Phd/YefM family antitoxin [Ignavibacteria bacterium]
MNESITANELKTKGISAINKILSKESEAIITVRGKDKFVVLPIDKYNQLREYELEAALEEIKRELKEGKFVEESIEEHIKSLNNV